MDGDPKEAGPAYPRGLADIPLRTWLEIAALAAFLVAGYVLLRHLKPRFGDSGAKLALVAAAAALSGVYSAGRWVARRLTRADAAPPQARDRPARPRPGRTEGTDS
jgi:hypothetical protein